MDTFIFILALAVVLAVIIWRSKQKASGVYPKVGTAFAYKLIADLSLTGWENGLPVFTEKEQEAIQTGLDRFQRDANGQMGGDTVFHPDAAPMIQRQIGSEALKELASEGDSLEEIFTNEDGPPLDWKERVSTYLKAWTMSLDPMILIDLSGLLAKTGNKKAASAALNVVISHFKGYAPKFFAGADKENAVTNQVIADARARMSEL
jgi:hypothetical protein